MFCMPNRELRRAARAALRTWRGSALRRVALVAMASSTAFTYGGEYYGLSRTHQLVKVKGPAWPPKNVKLFTRNIIKDDDGTERDETGQEMLARIKLDAVECEVRHATSLMHVRIPVR